MESAVDRGLARREEQPIENVGIDDKSFGKGHDYVSIMTDIDRSRVLEVAQERTIVACDSLWGTLTKDKLASVQSVAMDMGQAFMTSTAKNVPEAKIVHGKFHISKYLGEAVDKVRRAAHRELNKDGESSLTGLQQLCCTTKRIWMRTASSRS